MSEESWHAEILRELRAIRALLESIAKPGRVRSLGEGPPFATELESDLYREAHGLPPTVL